MEYAAKFSRVMFVLAAVILLTAAAAAAEETYVIDSKGESVRVFRVSADGKRLEIEGQYVGVSGEESGVFWLHVDGGKYGRNEMTGSQSGIYFFDQHDKPLWFLPYEEEVNDVSFSPGLKHVLIVKSGLVVSDLTLFSFGDAAKKASFESLTGPYWIDENRFASDMVEPDKGLRPMPPDSLEDFEGWSSIVICGAEGKITRLFEATETKNYMLYSVDMDEKTFLIYEITVKSEQDWADWEKWLQEELTVPFPEA